MQQWRCPLPSQEPHQSTKPASSWEVVKDILKGAVASPELAALLTAPGLSPLDDVS